MRSTWNLAALLILGLVAGACDRPGDPVDIDATGTVKGVAFLDLNGNEQLDQIDKPAPGVSVSIVRGTAAVVKTATTGPDGTFVVHDVEVGSYRIVATSGALGDSVAVKSLSRELITIGAGDTVSTEIRVGYESATPGQARGFAVGKRLLVEGVALNSWASFGDSTMHLASRNNSIRMIEVFQNNVAPGDSMRVLATVGTLDGQPVLRDIGLIVVLRSGALRPTPEVLSTGAASRADGGRLDAMPAEIKAAPIIDTATVAGDVHVTVDDGSGPLVVLFDRSLPFTFGPAFIPGGTLDAIGLLVPAPGGATWRLKPRVQAEATATLPTFSPAEARLLPVGKPVFLTGIALNAWATFGDSTVHVADSNGTIRAVQLPSSTSFTAGDSIRVLGKIGTRNGQPVVIASAPATLLKQGVGATARLVSTATAASAQGGTLDAALVEIRDAEIRSSAVMLPNGDQVVSIDDGSGLLEVVYDANINFQGSGSVATTGLLIDVTGVLVPRTGGGWQLKPRSANDARAKFPKLTIAQTRQLSPGRPAAIEGTALNDWSAFGDSTVHIQDASGVIRAVGVRVGPSLIFTGDSIRLEGFSGTRQGQPVLVNPNPIVLLTNRPQPTPRVVTTGQAANANGGTLDGALVEITSATVSDSAKINTTTLDIVFGIDDGSGRVEVFIDRSVPIPFASIPLPGGVVAVTGVLVPNATGTGFQIKPRKSSDFFVR